MFLRLGNSGLDRRCVWPINSLRRKIKYSYHRVSDIPLKSSWLTCFCILSFRQRSNFRRRRSVCWSQVQQHHFSCLTAMHAIRGSPTIIRYISQGCGGEKNLHANKICADKQCNMTHLSVYSCTNTCLKCLPVIFVYKNSCVDTSNENYISA